MKQLMLFIIFLIGAFSAKAEVTLTAILSHGDDIKTFQSSNAFAQAVAQAEDGDVITLSSGNFIATDITKSLLIRGAGMMPAENPTCLAGNFAINAGNAGNISFEGINFVNEIKTNEAQEVTFLKCWLERVSTDQNKSTTVSSVRFINTFANVFVSFANKNITSAQFINSYIKEFSRAENGCTFNATNSIIWGQDFGRYQNCIILGGPGNQSTFANCISNKYNFKGQSIYANNQYLPEIEDFFKEGTDRFELKEEYATRFIGNDGTQVGIHGGSLPFDPTTSSLKIKKIEVGARTTADGKLPIEIEIDGN